MKYFGSVERDKVYYYKHPCAHPAQGALWTRLEPQVSPSPGTSSSPPHQCSPFLGILPAFFCRFLKPLCESGMMYILYCYLLLGTILYFCDSPRWTETALILPFFTEQYSVTTVHYTCCTLQYSVIQTVHLLRWHIQAPLAGLPSYCQHALSVTFQ